ncbi:MAG: Mrp/NBP35 family ATP-binding protein [Rikenellaceae bacterium]
MEREIRVLLDSVTHPESGVGIHDGGFVESIAATEERICVTLRFERPRDPFAIKLKRRVEELLKEKYPTAEIVVLIKEGVAPRKAGNEKSIEDRTTTNAIAHTIAIASGKGGVGKSTVTSNLATTLHNMGYRVGVLDADIYGPSQARMFGCEGFAPEAYVEKGENGEEREVIVPAEVDGIKIMSIAFFIKATDPLLWRGTMASNALKQLLHQTRWGVLDFLLIDLPPGTGDIHLTILGSTKFSSAVIVSTPQGIALADVVRGVEMFAHPNVNVKVAGVIENMAYFTPDDEPQKRYYIFGRGGATKYAEERGLNLLGEIPIYESIVTGGESGTPASITDKRVAECYRSIAERVITHTI